MSDSFNLQRFETAQANVFEQALSEVQRGRKSSHWMWFIFPQLKGLGMSSTSMFYGITNAEEARAFLQHELLGARLVTICQAVLSVSDRSATQIFGVPDDSKLRSCATLFAQVSETGSVFHLILDKYFDGQPDPQTLQMLQDH